MMAQKDWSDLGRTPGNEDISRVGIDSSTALSSTSSAARKLDTPRQASIVIS